MSNIYFGKVAADSTVMEYFSFGTGTKTAVILPGIGIRPISVFAEGIAAQYSAFTRNYTVYVFDRKTELIAGDTVFTLADELASALTELGLSDICVFGASFGGMLAQALSVKHPELIKAMVLASTLSRPNSKSVKTLDNWMSLSSSGDVVALNRNMNENVYSVAFYEKNKAAFAAAENVGNAKELARLNILCAAAKSFDISDSLNKVKCRTLVIGTDGDAVLSNGAEDTAALIGCEYYCYSGHGHAVYDEAPDFVQKILCFFNENS